MHVGVFVQGDGDVGMPPKAIALNAQGKQVYRVWRPGELAEHIDRRLREKDAKGFHGGPYTRTLISLFTAEPALSFDFAVRELAAVRFAPFKQIDGAYLLFSYDPGRKRYPVIPLAIDPKLATDQLARTLNL